MTGIVITYNTHQLFKTMYESLRAWLPDLPLVIVDGSERKDSCHAYVRALAGGINTVYQLGENIGHGLGVHYAINRTGDEQLLIMDSDIEVVGNPVQAMAELLTAGVYGVGELDTVGADGLRSNPVRNVPFIQPYFMLMSRLQYCSWHRWVHHGTPSYKAMGEIWRQGLSGAVLRTFPVSLYVHHHWGGTRAVNKKSGKHEIPNVWEK